MSNDLPIPPSPEQNAQDPVSEEDKFIPDNMFEQAADYVLHKNRELYERLS